MHGRPHNVAVSRNNGAHLKGRPPTAIMALARPPLGGSAPRVSVAAHLRG